MQAPAQNFDLPAASVWHQTTSVQPLRYVRSDATELLDNISMHMLRAC